jgi:hypothetical protein
MNGHEVIGRIIGITRISCGPEDIGMKAKIPAEDTFIAALHSTAIAHHEL